MKTTARTTLLLLLLIGTMLASCTKKQFTIEFSLDPGITGNYRVVCLAADKRGARPVETVASVQQGKATLTLPCLLPTLVYISPTAGNATPPLVLYAEKGEKITLTGKEENHLSWSADGSETNRALTQWRLDNIAALTHDKTAATKAAAEYVTAHPDSRVSLILLLTVIDRSADEMLFRRLWQRLDKSLRTPEALAIAERADLLATVPVAADHIPATFEARLLDDSLVTVRQSDARATLYWCRTATDREGKKDADSLRRYFRRIAPDSLRLVTVAFDSDSIAMRRSVRLDSLPKALHLWEPEGAAGELARHLGAARTPFYITADSKGKILYHGESAAAAISALP